MGLVPPMNRAGTACVACAVRPIVTWLDPISGPIREGPPASELGMVKPARAMLEFTADRRCLLATTSRAAANCTMFALEAVKMLRANPPQRKAVVAHLPEGVPLMVWARVPVGRTPATGAVLNAMRCVARLVRGCEGRAPVWFTVDGVREDTLSMGLSNTTRDSLGLECAGVDSGCFGHSVRINGPWKRTIRVTRMVWTSSETLRRSISRQCKGEHDCKKEDLRFLRPFYEGSCLDPAAILRSGFIFFACVSVKFRSVPDLVFEPKPVKLQLDPQLYMYISLYDPRRFRQRYICFSIEENFFYRKKTFINP